MHLRVLVLNQADPQFQANRLSQESQLKARCIVLFTLTTLKMRQNLHFRKEIWWNSSKKVCVFSSCWLFVISEFMGLLSGQKKYRKCLLFSTHKKVQKSWLSFFFTWFSFEWWKGCACLQDAAIFKQRKVCYLLNLFMDCFFVCLFVCQMTMDGGQASVETKLVCSRTITWKRLKTLRLTFPHTGVCSLSPKIIWHLHPSDIDACRFLRTKPRQFTCSLQ